MTIEEKEPSRAERILAGTVAFMICMAVVFVIVAIFIGWRWSLRMFVGVLLIGIPGEILLELVGENRMFPRGGGKPGQTRAARLLILTLILAAWALIVLALTALIQDGSGTYRVVTMSATGKVSRVIFESGAGAVGDLFIRADRTGRYLLLWQVASGSIHGWIDHGALRTLPPDIPWDSPLANQGGWLQMTW